MATLQFSVQGIEQGRTAHKMLWRCVPYCGTRNADYQVLFTEQ